MRRLIYWMVPRWGSRGGTARGGRRNRPRVRLPRLPVPAVVRGLFAHPGFAALGRGALALGLVAVVLGGAVLLNGATRPARAPRAGPLPQATVEPAAVKPGSEAPPGREPLPERDEPRSNPDRADSGQWQAQTDPVRSLAEDIAAEVDIPARAVVAYMNAELGMRDHQPGCSVSWVTLAGIGRIESDHGRYAGRMLNEDGRSSSPIIGVPLDGGEGVRHLPDTDNGKLDGDPKFDRAIGPLQFIPSTWRKWGTDANGDGIADPFDLDDAAMSAARYLCASGGDLSSGAGWWSGVLAYNNSVDYGRKVYGLAEQYAAAGERRG